MIFQQIESCRFAAYPQELPLTHRVSSRLLNITQQFPSKPDSTSPSRFTFCHCTGAPAIHPHPHRPLKSAPFYTLPFADTVLGLEWLFLLFTYQGSAQMPSLRWSLPPHSPRLSPVERVSRFSFLLCCPVPCSVAVLGYCNKIPGLHASRSHGECTENQPYIALQCVSSECSTVTGTVYIQLLSVEQMPVPEPQSGKTKWRQNNVGEDARFQFELYPVAKYFLTLWLCQFSEFHFPHLGNKRIE